MRILIVEDERRLAEALGQIMEEQRYQADLVYDGADGVDYALTGQYDAIILDVMLPKVDGFEVARRLLMIHPRSVVPKEDIISRVWGLESDAEDNNVEVHISFLRKKLLYLSSAVTIGTVRKVGYYLEAPAE